MDYKVLSGKAVTGLDSYFSDKNQYVLVQPFFCADFWWAQVSETTEPLSFSAIFLSFWAKSLSFLGKSIKFLTKFLSKN